MFGVVIQLQVLPSAEESRGAVFSFLEANSAVSSLHRAKNPARREIAELMPVFLGL